MTYDEIIEQLEITKSKIKEIARNEYGGESWNDDLDALTEAADIVADYSKATAQASEMSQKYEQPAMAVRRAAGLYTCPLCGKRTQVGHTHCHWCGKKLSWDREAYADRDCPHLSCFAFVIAAHSFVINIRIDSPEEVIKSIVYVVFCEFLWNL